MTTACAIPMLRMEIVPSERSNGGEFLLLITRDGDECFASRHQWGIGLRSRDEALALLATALADEVRSWRPHGEQRAPRVNADERRWEPG